MNCEKARKWMSCELDDALDKRRQERLNEHLETCAECRAIREQWLRLRIAWKERLAKPTISAEAMWADVQRAIRTDMTPESAGSAIREIIGLHRGWAWAVAVTSIVAVLGISYMRWLRPSAPMPMSAAEPTIVEFVETELHDASPMVYQDENTGWTVIWVVEASSKES